MSAAEILTAALRSRWRQNKTAASALGVSGAYVSDVLSGRRRISVPFAVALAHALNDPTLATKLLYAQADEDVAKESP